MNLKSQLHATPKLYHFKFQNKKNKKNLYKRNRSL